MVYHAGPEDDGSPDDASEVTGEPPRTEPPPAPYDADDDLELEGEPDEPDEPDEEVAREHTRPGSSAPRESRRRRLERILPEILKRAIEKGLETGIGTLANGGEALRGVVGRGVVGGVELPKEVAGYVLSQVDDTKNAMVRVVAREVREFLEAADLAKELQRALTSLSFEIRTEIRFIPNDAGGVTPEVKAKVGPMKDPTRPRRGARRPSASEDE